MKILASLRSSVPDSPDLFERLRDRSASLAALVEAGSRRRDVRELRSGVLLVLLALRVPVGGSKGRSWYVEGAVARLGASGVSRLWSSITGAATPTLRTIREHLRGLVDLGAIAAAPGDWIPGAVDPEHPERRSRYPDTLIVLDGDRESSWWATEGRAILDEFPEARRNPSKWRRVLGDWRRRVGSIQHRLGFEAKRAAAAPKREALGRVLARAVRASRSARDVLAACASVGANLSAKAQWRAAAKPERLSGAAALLARALDRGDRILNLSGWLWAAFRGAPLDELLAAQKATR